MADEQRRQHQGSPLVEIGPDGIARESPLMIYTERIIEKEQSQLKQYIKDNYSKIRDVEKELENLTFELKLTAGPKKAALEHLRKKIELSTERIQIAKSKEDQARKVWEEAKKALNDEEAIKKKLCDDLNNLVQESTNTQFSRLEELKRRLEALNPSRASRDVSDGKITPQVEIDSSVSNSVSQQSATPVQSTVQSVQSTVKDTPDQQNQVEVPIDANGRGRKKNTNTGRGKGNMNLTKGRGSSKTGWTGAGFDVDGRL